METTRRAGLVAAILLLAVTPSAAPQSSRAPQNPTVPQNLPAPRRSTPPGDVYVSLATGPVQWRTSDGALRGELVNLVPGPAQGMRIDPSGNLYVARRCADASCTVGNSVEKFNPMGVSQGAVGGETGYNCNPHSIAFDAAGNTFVGQADCTGHVLQFTSDSTPHEHKVAPDSRGSSWIDLAGDGCTLFYTSRGPNVKRFDVCTKSQRPDFNVDLLPGGDTQGLRSLDDGGVLVASGAVVARLDPAGALIQTYAVEPSEPQYWVGLDLDTDGSFWAVNSATSNVYQFDLATGEVRRQFNTGTAPYTAVDVVLRRGKKPSPAPPGGVTLH